MTQSSLELRRRLARLVKAFPGLHLRELARQADLSEALAGYHLHALAEGRLIEGVTDGGFLRFFPLTGTVPPDADRDLVSILRQRASLQIVVLLLDREQAANQEITGQLGLAKSTVSYHLGKLSAAGILVPAPDGRGFRLREPQRIQKLLLRWEPPTDWSDRFSALWESFYHRRRGK